MCRYAMSTYKPHYACFSCRKTFKRRLIWDIDREKHANESIPAKCPQCGELMADMGMDFKAPKKDNVKAWKHLSTLYSVEITFHSCGCNGPGRVPRNKEELVEHFEQIKKGYLVHQHFWARRKEDPTTQSQIDKDKHENLAYLLSVPRTVKSGSRKKPQYDALKAQQFWVERIVELESKIRLVQQQS